MAEAISVVQVAGTSICVSAEDADKLYQKISGLLQEGRDVAISFSGVERLTTAFLNVGIGQLYNEFSEEVIRQRLSIAEADASTLNLLKTVVDRAKIFYKNRDAISKAADDNQE